MPYFYPNHPNTIILNGELEFDKTEHPKDILKKLCRTAEEIGAMVCCKGVYHGGVIRVYPAYDPEYYVLNMYLDDPNDLNSKLRITDVDTWRQVDVMRLVK